MIATAVSWFLGTKVGRGIAFGVVFVALLAVAYWRIFTAGKKSERVEQARVAYNMRKKADEVEARVDAASAPELEQLRNRWTRPGE